MKDNKRLPKIGISIGDVNGIGPEIILKTFESRQIFDSCIPIVYANTNVLNFYRKQLNLNDLKINHISEPSLARPRVLNLIEIWNKHFNLQPGNLDSDAGEMAFKSLEALAGDMITEKIEAGVTAPINKENTQNAGFNFPGQTEFFCDKAGAKESLILLCSDLMRIGLVSGHIPITKLKEHLNQDLITSKLNLLIKSLKNDFGLQKPKIAILGLNPHAGENGKIGNEELDLIQPVINTFKQKGEFVFGPYPSDGLFGSGNYRKFDGILAMYHDQALIPFKMISFENGVNYTAGLKIIRTSPDHGTAFDIAGKGTADESSFRQALYTAIDIWKQRIEI